MSKVNSENKKDNSVNNEALEAKFQELENLLHNIRNDFDKYQAHFSSSSDENILERLIGIEKEFKLVLNNFKELKNDVKEYKKSSDELMKQYQEVVGSINQLRLGIDEINERYKSEKEHRLNVFWQILIPIVLSLMFFIFGIFFKSCSSIHNENVHGKQLNTEYVDFNKK